MSRIFESAITAIRSSAPRQVVLAGPRGGLSIEINPQACGIISTCTFAIPMTATAATPAIVAAIVEARR